MTVQPFELTHDGGLPIDPAHPMDVKDASIGSPGAPAPAGVAVVGGTDGVDARALAVDPSGVLQAETATLARRYGGGKKPYAAELTGNASITPALGKRLEIFWVSFIPRKTNAAGNLVTMKFQGAAETCYIGYAMAHWEYFIGDVDQAFQILLETAEPVAVTVHYREI